MISHAVIAQAADWVVTLTDDDLSPEQRQRQEAACVAWRDADPQHEQAWQRLNALKVDLDAQTRHLSPNTAHSVIDAVSAQKRRRRAIGRLLTLAGVTVLGVNGANQLPWRLWTSQYHTVAGGRRAIVLADGTRLLLNTRTALDVQFDARSRAVRLYEGEILVETGRDPAGRPFVVDTPNGTVTPIGTRFVVSHLTRDDPDTAVSVMAGAVEIRPVDAPGSVWLVRSGEQTAFGRDAMRDRLPLDGTHTDWIDAQLIARNMRLADFIQTVSRYRTGLLYCDSAVENLRLTGTFPLQDSDKILRVLTHMLPVSLSERSRYWIKVVPAESRD